MQRKCYQSHKGSYTVMSHIAWHSYPQYTLREKHMVPSAFNDKDSIYKPILLKTGKSSLRVLQYIGQTEEKA